MSDVFVSHSSKDKTAADGIVEFLESRGVSCWIAPRNIVPGSDWAASISTAITASRIFLLIYSVNTAESEQCSREMSLAESTKSVSIIPYKVDGAELKGAYLYYLTGAHWVTADVKKKDYKYEELYSFIAGILGKNVENINANTYIDHLHIENAEKFPEDLSEAMKKYVGRNSKGVQESLQDGTDGHRFGDESIQESSANNSHRKSKLPVIIGAACAAVVLAVIVIIIVVSLGKSDNKTDGNDTLASSVTGISEIVTQAGAGESEAAEVSGDNGQSESDIKPTVSDTYPTESAPVPTDVPATPTEAKPTEYVPQTGERKNITVTFINKKCTMDYVGEINEAGQPDGEGEYIGTYVSGEETVQVTYKGTFIEGVVSGKGVSTEKYEDGHIREYNGVFADNNWNGDAVLTITYISGNITKNIYEGTWTSGVQIGEGKETTYFVDSGYTYEGNFGNNGKWEGYGIYKKTDRSGNTIEYSGEFLNSKQNGKGTWVYTYADGEKEKQVCEGEFIDDKFTGPLNILTNYFRDKTKQETKGEYKEGSPVFGITTTYDVEGKITDVSVDKPKNLHVEDATTETVRVVWDSTELDVKFYMEVYKDLGLSSKLVEKLISGNSIKLSGLSAGETLYVRIRTEYEFDGVTYHSDWADITVAALEKDDSDVH